METAMSKGGFQILYFILDGLDIILKEEVLLGFGFRSFILKVLE